MVGEAVVIGFGDLADLLPIDLCNDFLLGVLLCLPLPPFLQLQDITIQIGYPIKAKHLIANANK